MRLGLEAKVRPQLDERQAEQEASRLRDTFDDALGDLSATLEMEDVLERTSEMQEEVEEMEDSFETIEEAAWRDTGGTFARGRPGQEPQPQQDGAGMMDTVKEMGMDKLQDKLPDGQDGGGGGDGGGMMGAGGGGMMARAGGLIGGSGGSGGIMSALSGILAGVGVIGSALLGGAAAVGLIGAGLFALFGIADKLDQHSPLLAQVVGMWDMAMSLMIRPFASLLGRFLLPIATGVLTLAANFNRVFGERGIMYALGWLAVNIVHGMAEFFWNIIKWAVKALIGVLVFPIIATVVILKSLLSWFMNSIGPVLGALEPLLWFLLPFIILGMQAFKMIKEGWPRIEKFLSGIYDWAKNPSIGGAIGGSLDILKGGVEFSWDIIKWTGKISWGAIKWGGKILWGAIAWGGKILWGAIKWGGKILWGAIAWGGRILWGAITWGGEIAWDAISWGGEIAWDAITWAGDITWDAITWTGDIAWDAIVWMGSLDWSDIVWSGAVGLGRWMFDGAVDLGKWIFSGAISLGKWIFSGAISLGNWLFEGAINITDYIVGGVGSTVERETGWEWPWKGASGGIVTGPTPALIGEGRESEAVLPLSRLEQLISTPDQPGTGGISGGSITLDVSGDVGEMDEDSIAESIASALEAHFGDLQTSVEDLRKEIRRKGLGDKVVVTADGKILAEVVEDGTDTYRRSREVNK